MININNRKLGNGKIAGVDYSPNFIKRHAAALANLEVLQARGSALEINNGTLETIGANLAIANAPMIQEHFGERVHLGYDFRIITVEMAQATIAEGIRRLRWWLCVEADA